MGQRCLDSCLSERATWECMGLVTQPCSPMLTRNKNMFFDVILHSSICSLKSMCDGYNVFLLGLLKFYKCTVRLCSLLLFGKSYLCKTLFSQGGTSGIIYLLLVYQADVEVSPRKQSLLV